MKREDIEVEDDEVKFLPKHFEYIFDLKTFETNLSEVEFRVRFEPKLLPVRKVDVVVRPVAAMRRLHSGEVRSIEGDSIHSGWLVKEGVKKRLSSAHTAVCSSATATPSPLPLPAAASALRVAVCLFVSLLPVFPAAVCRRSAADACVRAV